MFFENIHMKGLLRLGQDPYFYDCWNLESGDISVWPLSFLPPAPPTLLPSYLP